MRLAVAPDVEAALAAGRPVVALESTVICHGLPRPRNLAAALALEAEVRAAGALPATTALVDGEARIGLDGATLARLAAAEGVAKCSSRDLPVVLASGGQGATTVAATLVLAASVGIAVMATGGIGGVHRGGELSLDVSADLAELARRPVAVVCSGAKAILDLPRTLELLESRGVPVVGYRTDHFPAFYARDSGLEVPRVDDVGALARLLRAQRLLGQGGGVVVANPPPAVSAIAPEALERLIALALAAAREAGVRGPAETPFLLEELARRSGGATLRANEALLRANARLAGELAVAVAAAEAGEFA